MTALTFHPPTPDRLRHIADHLRAADLAEIAITSPGDSPREVIEEGARESRLTITAAVDGVPAIVYGVAPTTDPHVGRAWMLATDDLLKVRREFLASCRAEVRLMQQTFAVLTNEVHRDNAVAIRWLEWLGFTIDRERPVGPDGALFVFWKGSARRV